MNVRIGVSIQFYSIQSAYGMFGYDVTPLLCYGTNCKQVKHCDYLNLLVVCIIYQLSNLSQQQASEA